MSGAGQSPAGVPDSRGLWRPMLGAVLAKGQTPPHASRAFLTAFIPQVKFPRRSLQFEVLLLTPC